MAFRVLFCLDDRESAKTLQEHCRRLDCETLDVRDPAEVRERCASGGVDVALLELRLLHRDPELLSDLAALEEAPSTLVLCEEAELPQALALVRSGATGALPIPSSVGLLACALEQARKERIRRIERQHRERDEILPRNALLGRSREHRHVLESIARVASTPSTTVLLQGELGVGKERIARAIHAESNRSRGPFLVLRCGARQPISLDELLFGREPGPGRSALAGLLHAAQGGTLYIDEISRLDPDSQTLLSRALNDRTWRRVGSQSDLALDARVIAASREDLSTLVDEERFSEELFYRLNVLTIPVPPLRDRAEDVAPYTRHFLDQLGPVVDRSPLSLSAEAMQALEQHPWPGNLVELEATLALAVLSTNAHELRAEHLRLDASAPAEHQPSSSGALSLETDDLSVKSMEKALIRHVLAVTSGNRSEAARMLQVNRATLYNKLKQYEL